MALFPCTYFTVQTKYPTSGVQVRLGNSYTYTAPPPAPDQRTFIVKVQGMQYFVAGNGSIDTTSEVGRNMAVLEQFYNDHKMYMTFQFTHPVYGLINCKFSRPLEIPEGVSGGNGILPTFDLEMIEIP
jgi:hypothetical protein